MKKGVIIGAGIGLGLAALGVAVLLIILNATKFKPREDGFAITSTNYGSFISQCETDAILSDYMKATNPMKYKVVGPFKTGQYTEDGFPVWAVGQVFEGIGNSPDVEYLCRLGTNEETAYLINLYIDGKKVKSYIDDIDFVNKDGEPF